MIYGIENTEQAEIFGQNATCEQAKELKKAETIYSCQYMETWKITENLDSDAASRLAGILKHKQLCSEALAEYRKVARSLK